MNEKPLEGMACPPSLSAPQNSCAGAESSACPTSAEKSEPSAAKKSVSPGAQVDANKTQPYPPALYVPAAPFVPSRCMLWALPFSYLLGWFYMRWLVFNMDYNDYSAFGGWSLPVFCLIFFGGCEWLLRKAGRKASVEAWAWMAFCLLLAADHTVKNLLGYGGSSFYVFEMMALHGAAAYWVVCRAGLLLENATGPMLPLDGLNALVGLPFGNFFLRIRSLWYGTKQIFSRVNHKKRNPWPALVTLILAIPLFCIAVSLLAGADAGFSQWLSKLYFDFTVPSWLYENFWCFVWGLPVGAFLYGLLAGALRKQRDPSTAPALRAGAEKARLAPVGALAAAMAAFLLLYVAFFIFQASYLLGGFQGILPIGFTAAGYARSGFFQLCAIVMLNFGLLTLAVRCSARPLRRTRLLKGLALALCGANLLFAAVSFSKLYLYISRFGFTVKRIQSAWFTLVLVVLTVLAVCSILRPFKAVRAGVFAVCALFLALCLCQPELLIQKGNQWLENTGRVENIVEEGRYNRW